MSNEKTKQPKRINGSKKGKQFERDVANALGHIFPESQRMLEYQASKVIGVDLENTGEFAIQCKRNASYCPVSKITEIRDTSRTPVLITKGNNVPPMAVLPFKDLIGLLERIPGMKQEDNVINGEAQAIATTAKAVEFKEEAEEDTKVFDGQVYSGPKKNESFLSEHDAKQTLQGVTGLLVRYMEGIPENRIRLSYKDKKDGSMGSAYFHNEWRRSSGAARAMVSIEEWCDQYDAIPHDLCVRHPGTTEDMPEIVAQVEEETAPEPEPQQPYSFI